METLVVSLELVELEWLMRDLPLVEDFGVSCCVDAQSKLGVLPRRWFVCG